MAPIVRIQRPASHQKCSVPCDHLDCLKIFWQDAGDRDHPDDYVKPGLTRNKSISTASIFRFQFYFYETRSGSQSLRMQFFRSDPLDVIDLVLMAYNARVINHTLLYDGKNILAQTKSPTPLPQPHHMINSQIINP